MGQQYKYDFSVVMAVYNVEPYLREAVESLVHQTIGFSRIQLIMVDDGSTDKSGEICDEYLEKFPENVVVIHKENGRQASARNAGIPYIKGKYVSFMDPDDTLNPDAMEKVRAFLDRHKETDICCIPMYFFGKQTGSHSLNYKFAKGTRVVNLTEEENAACLLLSAASAFYRADTAKRMRFDTELYHAEDAKENLRLLMERPILGLVADTKYNYRKHGNSTIDRAAFRALSYTPYLKNFSCWALDRAEKKYGTIPRFVQHAVMYDLQWKLKQNKAPEGVLNEQEKKEYYKLLIDTACRIDDDVILQQKSIWNDMKIYLLAKKYGTGPELKPDRMNDQNLELCFGERAVAAVSEMKTVLEFIRIDRKNSACILEGYHIVYGIKEEDIKPYLLANGKMIPCETINRDREATRFHEEKINEVIGFKGTVPLTDRRLEIGTLLKVRQFPVKRKNHIPGKFFPVCTVYKNAYSLEQDCMITMEKTHLIVGKRPLLPQLIHRECLLLAEIWKKNRLGGRKAVGGRLYYHLLNPFKRKQLWLISDRIMKADDNGEALFRYLRKNPPENTRVVFAVSKKSADYERMKKVGPCVDAMSFRHKLLHLLCDVNISAQADWVTVNPFEGHSEALRDLLTHQRFVFLQHGITKDDISGWLNRYEKDISGFVTAAYREYKSIVEGDYAYPASQIWLTGFPRYDRLYHNEEKVVTVMPTWRQYLMSGINGREGTWNPSEGYAQSEYCLFYNKLLNSKRLLNALDHYGYRLQFFPHPNTQPAIHCFHRNEKVVFLPLNSSYRDVYARSQLVVTDYSSAVFDFAYLRKPVLYCQFDRERVFAGEHVTRQGYFDYEKDGFGEVTYDLDSLVDLIIWYVKNGCMLKDLYRKRIDDFFAFNDQNSCKRVTEKILAMPDKE